MKTVTPAALSGAMLVGAVPAGQYAKAYPRAIQRFRPRADVNDPAAILAQLSKDFADFKAENDRRLAGKADVVQTEKVDRINTSVTELQAAIDEMNRRIAALSLNGGGGISGSIPDTAETREYTAAFNALFRRGEGTEAELKALAVKAALTTQEDPSGGYLVAPEIEQTIDRVLMKVSAMRGLATVRTLGSSTYKKLVGQGGTKSGWVGEQETRPETGTPTLAELEFPAMEIYAEPGATQNMLDDSRFDIGAWLADEVNIEFAEQEGAAFINGNGVKRPRGILKYDAVDNGNWSWGKLGYIVSGAAADLTSADPLIDLTYGIKKGFRSNATWLANRSIFGKVRKLKNGEGDYLWQPSTQLGQPASLNGYPVEDDDNMPDLAAGAFPIAFGDFKRGYLIVDRAGIRVLRDPYTKKGYVLFYTTKRVGGGVQQFEAIKLLKISA